MAERKKKRMTLAEVNEHRERIGLRPKKRLHRQTRRKYGNKVCADPVTSEKFDSKLERRVWQRLRGMYPAVLRQVSIPVRSIRHGKPSPRLVADFLEIHELREDGTFVGRFSDAKGQETRVWKNKRGELEANYGVEVKLYYE